MWWKRKGFFNILYRVICNSDNFTSSFTICMSFIYLFFVWLLWLGFSSAQWPSAPYPGWEGSSSCWAEVLSAGFELPLFPLSVCSFPPRISNLNPERSSARTKGTGASVQHGSKYGLRLPWSHLVTWLLRCCLFDSSDCSPARLRCHSRSQQPLSLTTELSPQPLPLLLWCGAMFWNSQGPKQMLSSGWSTLQGACRKPTAIVCNFNVPSPLCFWHKQAYAYSSQAESRLPSALLLVPLPLQPTKGLISPVSNPRAGVLNMWL